MRVTSHISDPFIIEPQEGTGSTRGSKAITETSMNVIKCCEDRNAWETLFHVPLLVHLLLNVWNVSSLASSHSHIAVTAGRCLYVFDLQGNTLATVCGGGEMRDVSISNGTWVAVNDDGYAYLLQDGLTEVTFLRKVKIGKAYSFAVAALPGGFVACKWMCALFDLEGRALWRTRVGLVLRSPLVIGGRILVPDHQREALVILDKESGRTVNLLPFDDVVIDVDSCGNYLAVTTNTALYLFTDRLEMLWKRTGFLGALQVAFSPDCKLIATADYENKKVRIFDVNGREIFEEAFKEKVTSLLWMGRFLIVGTERGVYLVYGAHEKRSGVCTYTITITTTFHNTTTLYRVILKTIPTIITLTTVLTINFTTTLTKTITSVSTVTSTFTDFIFLTITETESLYVTKYVTKTSVRTVINTVTSTLTVTSTKVKTVKTVDLTVILLTIVITSLVTAFLLRSRE